MNSQELEALFIESNELNSHNQISQFKKAVILSKEKHNPGMDRITYDTPVYFDIIEVYRYIKNKNNEVINKNETLPHLPKRSDGTIIDNADEVYLTEEVVFSATSTCFKILSPTFPMPVSSTPMRASVSAFSLIFSRILEIIFSL